MRVLIAWRMLTHAAGLPGKVSRTHGCAGPGGYSPPSARPKTDPVSSPAGFGPPICSLVSGSESQPPWSRDGREAELPAVALSPQPPGARLHLWSRAGLFVCVWFPDSGFDVRAGLLMEAWRGDRLCTHAHAWQLPQQSPGAGRRQAGEGWLVAKGPAGD